MSLCVLRQIDAVELDALVRLDEQIPDAADRARLHEIRPLRIDRDRHIRRLEHALFHIDQIPGIEHRAAAEGLVKLRAELHPLILRHAAAFQHVLELVAADDQRIVAFGLLPGVDPVLEFLPDLLHDGQRAFLIQRIAQHAAEGVALLVCGHRRLDTEQRVDERLIVRAGGVGIEQAVVKIGPPSVEGREEKAHLRHPGRPAGGAVMEGLLLRDIAQQLLAGLHGADGTNKVGEDLAAVFKLGAVPGLEGDVVALVRQQDEVVFLKADRADDRQNNKKYDNLSHSKSSYLL